MEKATKQQFETILKRCKRSLTKVETAGATIQNEDEEFHETFLSQSPINEIVMRKGEWRHVRGSASKIREHMQEELERRQKSRLGTAQGISKSTLAVSTAGSHLPAKPGSRQRRRGPLRAIEICTWTCMMSITAASLGWEAWGPVTLPGFDLLTLRGREAARE